MSQEILKALSDLVEIFDARPDIAQLLGPLELKQYADARQVICDYDGEPRPSLQSAVWKHLNK